MIVDDSPVARAVLSRMLASHPEFEVVALAGNAVEALEALDSTPIDIVLLDVEMPGTSGLEALPEILRRGRNVRVLIVSSLCADGAESTVRALALGAADTLPKPGTSSFEGRFSDVLADRLRRLGMPKEPFVPPPPVPTAVAQSAVGKKLGCLAVGASTGGLHAISELLTGLPDSIGAPLLVTQHLPAVFIPFFARQIETACGRTTRVAEDGLTLEPDVIVLAPGDAHLCIERQGRRVRVRLDRSRSVSGCKPSVDVMLSSVAAIYGPAALGVVLSGMGRDGLEGSGRIVERGGTMLVQDSESSAVWGMPRAVAEAGLASAILPPAGLAERVARHARGDS